MFSHTYRSIAALADNRSSIQSTEGEDSLMPFAYMSTTITGCSACMPSAFLLVGGLCHASVSSAESTLSTHRTHATFSILSNGICSAQPTFLTCQQASKTHHQGWEVRAGSSLAVCQRSRPQGQMMIQSQSAATKSSCPIANEGLAPLPGPLHA